MKTKIFIQIFSLAALFSLMASCAGDEPAIEPSSGQTGIETTTIPLNLSAAPPSFDSTSTRTVLEWPDGAKLYFKFHLNSGYTVGTGIYSSRSGEWTLTYSGVLESEERMRCEVWYFENAERMTEEIVTLNTSTCVYYDSSAEYILLDGGMYISAHLRPESARLQFSGTAKTTLTIGLPRHESFDIATFSFSNVTISPFALNIENNGYTPFFYAHVVDSTTTRLEVTSNSDTYLRDFEADEVLNGKSYVLRVPNEEMVEQKKWTKTALTFTVTGNGKTVEFTMILVEAGTFQMGRAGSTDIVTPVHSVTLTRNYYMCETEVTQALWYAVMGQSPTSDGNQWSNAYGLGDDYPAYYISYEDCQSFLSELNNKLSFQHGSSKLFRFPTEAEWEFAAKGGNKSDGYIYSGSYAIGDVAWYYDNSGNKTHQVKTKAANELGLYDMSGNVWEWCYDRYGSYSSNAQTNPSGPTLSSFLHYDLRGGGWRGNPTSCSVAYRGDDLPSSSYNYLGLRLCLGAPIE